MEFAILFQFIIWVDMFEGCFTECPAYSLAKQKQIMLIFVF